MTVINCDMGEAFGLYKMGDDVGLMPLIDVANVACGFHGSDFNHMRTTVQLAKKHGVTVVSLVGAKRGRMAEISDFTIVVEDTHYGRAEDVQMHILHMMCYAFMENDSLREAGA